MRALHSSPLTLVLSSLALAAVSACGGGDPGGASDSSASESGDSGDSGADSSVGSTSAGSMSASGSTSTSTTSAADETSSASEESTGEPDDSTTGSPDADMDGLPDGSDNCPDTENPNQLDFDGNGTGNVCDTMVFTGVAGQLDSVLFAAAGIAGDCSNPVTLDVTSGQIMARFDDDGAMVDFQIVNLQIADVVDLPCNLAVMTNLSLTDFAILNDEAFPVSVPHDLAMHDAGALSGSSDSPHPHASLGTFTADLDGEENAFELTGELPTFSVAVSGFGSTASLTFDDDALVLGTEQFMVEQPFPITLDLSLTGLSGTLTLEL